VIIIVNDTIKELIVLVLQRRTSTSITSSTYQSENEEAEKKNKNNSISSNYVFKGLAFETLGPWCKKPSISLMSSETDLSRNQAIQNQSNSFSRGFPLPFNVETLQAFGALFQIPQYYRKLF
jgi:hypothetical protein